MPVEHIDAEELRRLLRERPEDVAVIDVRSGDEYDALHIKGSLLIPMEELPRRAHEVPWQKEVVFVCRSGKRSGLTAELAAAAGVPVKNLRLGILECAKSGDGTFLEGNGAGGRSRLR